MFSRRQRADHDVEIGTLLPHVRKKISVEIVDDIPKSRRSGRICGSRGGGRGSGQDRSKTEKNTWLMFLSVCHSVNLCVIPFKKYIVVFS